MLKFKVGDKVKITSGKDKGREGTIEKVFSVAGKAVLPGLNEYKKHIKPSSGKKGGIFSIPRPIALSKLRLICPSCSKETKVGFRIAGDVKMRFCKKCGKEIAHKK